MGIGRVGVEIITIGDEILIGQIVDTNSAWMAKELNHVGLELIQIRSVHDDAADILQSLDQALTRADVVLFTGGIGPTKDDITKQTLCDYFDTRLVFDESVYQNILRLFAHRSSVMNELTKSQAFVPEVCTVIQNLVGTAPITWFEKDGKVIVSMPGVPFEMKSAMLNDILPRLKSKFNTPVILHKTVQVHGYPESALALKIADWESCLPANIKLAYLPAAGIVKLRLSGYSVDNDSLESDIDSHLALLGEILGKSIVSHNDGPIEQLISELLIESGKMLSTAESCTGGNIAHLFTSLAGSSVFYKGSVVAYSSEVKQNLLKVSEDDLRDFGAVSQIVVEQMAEGVCRLLQSDYAIATSGIAGPTGGSAEKPVGTVWIAVSSADRTVSRECHFGSLRDQNIQRASLEAMLLLKEVFLS